MGKWIMMAVVAVVLFGCSSKQEATPAEEENEIVVEYATRAIPVSEDAVSDWLVEDGRITISADDPLAAVISRGKVLVGGSLEKHFLRKVISVQVVNGKAIVNTKDASLTDAFKTLKIDFSTARTAVTASNIHIYRFTGMVYEAENWHEVLDVELNSEQGMPAGWKAGITGDFNYRMALDAMANVDVKINLLDSRLQECALSVSGGVAIELQEYLTGEESLSKSVSRQVLPSTRLMVLSIGPVWIDLTGRMDAGVTLGLDSELNVTAQQKVSGGMTVGVAYNGSEWQPITASQFVAEARAPQLTTSMKGTTEAFIAPTVSFDIFNIAGPYAALKNYGRLTGQVI